MQKAILAVGVIEYNRVKLFFANYKVLRKQYGVVKSLRLALDNTKNSRALLEAEVGIDIG